LILLFFSIYAISYLQIKDKKDKLIITTAGFVHLAFYGTTSLIFGDIPSTDSLYFLPFVAILWIAIKERMKNGQKVSANFIAGASFFLLTIIIEELRHQKLLFGGFWVVFNFHITLVVQSIILSLSIFDRLKSIRAEKETLNQNMKNKEIETVSQQFQTLGHEHIAKELRSLLTLLKSPLEGAMNGQETEQNTKNLQDVHKATLHIERFVESILNDDPSTLVEDLYTGDVMRTASDTISELKYIAIEKGVALNISRDPQSLICHYNNHQFQSIIFNASLLAIKSAANNTKIDASLKEEHDKLELSLFYTMGLDLVSDSEFLTDILRKACGAIGASFKRTCEGRSCVVKLALPFQALSIEEPSPTQIQDARIMIIDSNDRLMNYVGEELELPIIKMVSAKRGLELLKKHQFDLIITEIKDLDLSGTELISEIRKTTQRTSLIVLSGNKSSKDKNEIIGLGVEGYMSKPFNIEELKERITYLLKKQEQEIQSAQKNSIMDSSVERVLLPKQNDFMQQVIEAIDEQLGDPNFNVDQLAHKIGMSRAQLYRKFKSEVGESVKEFIRNYRLKVAGKLLKETSLSVKEVMIHVGFLNRQHFSKSFKEAHNLSPSAFKQRYSVALN
jgi:AraC-like DNA-binding protein/CheY-like chemotaxis protein